MTLVTRIFAALALLLTAASVAGCGTSSKNASTVHNAHDVEFAQNMIPHHQQAVEMAAMVPTRSTNPDVLRVAKSISSDQQAEIHTMTAMLSQWGTPTTTPNGGMPMSGMVDASTIKKLHLLSGKDFDDLWMRSMIAHHQGAVTMSRAENAQGKSPDAIKLAKMMIVAQQRETSYLNHLLSTPE